MATYTWEDESTTYILKKDGIEVARITNLKAAPTEPESDSGEIELSASMLNDEHTDITLINQDGYTYTLKLADGVTKYGSIKSGTVTKTVTNGTATIKGTLEAGWKETSGTEITYQGDTANQTIAEITGLKSDAAAGDLTIDGNDITLADEILGSDTIRLSNTAPGDFDLKLSAATVGGGLSDESGWAAEGTTAYFRDVTNASWTLDSTTTVTYHEPESTDLVKITGLSDKLAVDNGVGKDRKIGTNTGTGGAFVEGIIFGAGGDAKKITLKASVLGEAKVELGGTGEEYTLALDGAVPTEVELADPLINLSGTTATVTGTLKAYYILEDTEKKSITYKAPQNPTFATITGLSSTASTDATTGNISVALSDNSGTPKFTVKLKGGENGALGTSKIELTPATVEDKGNTFTFNAELALTDSNPTTGKLGYDESDKYWSVSGRTATYQYDTGAGYTFNTTTRKAITYDQATKTELASISNLAKNLSSSYVPAVAEVKNDRGVVTTAAQPAKITGIAVADTPNDDGKYEITLDKNVLGNEEMVLDSTDYVLALGGTVPQAVESDKVVLTLGANGAALTSSDTACWTLDGTKKSISYTPETDKRELATITGLKSTDVTEAQIADNLKLVDENDDPLSLAGEGITIGVIKLGLGLLNGKNVAITNGANGNFTLDVITGNDVPASVKVSAPVATEPAWTVSSTTATYKANLTAGYEVKSDGTGITYTAAHTGTNKAILATVKGLKSGFTNANISEQFTFGTDLGKEKEITIAATALGTSDVTVTGTNYTLALPASGIVKSDDTVVTNGKDVWRVSGTTATYKKVTPAYYTLGTGATSITYTAEADIPVDEETTTTYATITGLKSGLKVNTDDTIIGIALGSVDGGTFMAGTGTVVQLSKDVLTTNTATPVIVTNGYAATKASQNYELALNNDVTLPTENDDKKWNVTNVAASGSNPASVTATYKGSITAGWELGTQEGTTGNNQITYKAREASHTFATIEGLKSGVTAQQLNKTSENEHIAIDGTVITLKKAALGTSPTITVKGNDGYTIALDDSAEPGFRTSDDTGYIWEADGTTYTYKNVDLDFYAQGTKKDDQDNDVADNNKIVYTAQRDRATIAKFAGLKSGLLDANGDMPTAAIEVDNDSAKTFTVTEDALNKADVTISYLATDWSIEEGFARTNLQPCDKYWKLDGTNATYQHEVKAGYEIQKDANDNPTKITYTADTIVTDAGLSGLKSGLSVVSGGIVGITVNPDTNVITLDSSKVLTDNNVKLETVEGGTAYTLSLENDYEAPHDHNTAWVINGTTAKLVNYRQAFYEVNTTSDQIIYTKAKIGTSTDYSPTATEVPSSEILATLTNLKSGLRPVDGQIDGLAVSGNDIVVSANVLDKKTVANTLEDSTYGLELDSSGGDGKTVSEPAESGKWAIDSKGVPTYTSTTTAGYKVDGESDSETYGQILYSPQKVIKATINGLKEVVISNDGSEVGLKGGTSIAPTYRGIDATFTPTVNDSSGATEKLTATIDLTGEILNKKAVTLSVSGGTVDHTFSLESGVEVEAEDPVWNKAKGTNYATYTQTTPAGYSIADDEKKINYASSPSTKTIVKVVGLSKDIASSENDELVGVDYTTAHTPADNSDPDNPVEAVSGVITLSKEVLTNTNVTIGNEYDYKLALSDPTSYAVGTADPSWTYDKNKGTATIKVGTTEGWAHKVTKKKVDGVETTITDEKTIQYTPANLTSIATVSGLKKDLTVTDGSIEGLTIGTIAAGATANDPSTGTIGITSAVLNKANVKIDIPSAQKNKYKFTFTYDANDIKTPETGTAYWLTDQKKGNTSYQSDVTAGYDLNTTQDAFTYSAETKSVYFTLSGLKKDSTGDTAKKSNEFAGIEVSTGTPKTKTVNKTEVSYNEYEVKLTDMSILDEKKVTITNKTKNDDYNLNVDAIAVENGGNKWTVSGTTATLKDYDAAGYTIASNNKSASYTDATAKATLLTIKGLKSGSTEADVSIDDENKVTLSANALGTSTISITQGKTRAKTTTSYSFDPDMDSLAAVTRSAEDPTWTVSNGTATLKQVTGDGFVAPEAENPTSLVYKKKSTETLATVKGLSADLGVYSAAQLEAAPNLKNTQIFTTTTTKDAQGKKVVTQNTSDIAITYDAELKTITLNKAAFNKKKVTVSGSGGYTLALDGDVPTYAQTATEWTVSGTNANYRTYKQLYYEAAEDGKSVNYIKEENGITYATVSGLKKGVTDAMLADVWTSVTAGDGASGGVLTLDARFLGTSNVKIATKLDKTDKVDNFVLALSSNEDADKKVTTSGVTSLQAWSKASSGKSVLKGTLTAGYTLEFGGKTISYTNEKKNQVIATVSGLKNGAQISDSSGVITLNESQLNGKNVAVTTSKGTTDYKITYSGTAPEIDPDSEKLPSGTTTALTSANPKGTFTLKGYVTTAGYTDAESGKAITYTKANADTKKVEVKNSETGVKEKIDVYKATATLATITNIDKGELPTVSGNTITVEGNQVTNAKKPVTVNAGLFTVEFDAKYNNKAVTGSGNVDKITIKGTGVSVTGGKGDDEIDLGSGTNTLIYSNGDGNDVIANFTPGTDTLQIKSGTPLVEKSGDDFIVKVGTGSITLTGAADGHDELTIYNNKGVDTTYTTSAMVSSPLLADDNYSMDAAQLSSIVEPTQTALTPYDYNTNFDFTKDNKMISAVTYAKSK